MSAAENPNSDLNQASAGGGRGKKLIILLLAVLLLGGGAGAYFYLSRPAPADDEETAEKTEGASKKGKSKKGSSSEDDEDGSGDEDVKSVIDLQPFIVNLNDSEQARYLRLNVTVGIAEGGGEKPDQLFITRVRNAMLVVLSAKTSEDVLSSAGKAKLRKELLKAARKASQEPEVKAIYITDFIVQM
jgi:flagellar FliL protein